MGLLTVSTGRTPSDRLAVGRSTVAVGCIEPESVDLFGIPFARITQSGLVDQIERMVRGGGRHWVVTANIQHLGIAARDAKFLKAIRSADLVTADGKPICWAARLMRSPLPARVTGADLILPLAQRCEARGWRMMLMGGGPGVAEELAARLQPQFPKLQIVGALTPPLLSLDALLGDETESALRTIHEARPDVLLLALGTPKQELWIERCFDRLDVPVSVGVGAAFDFLVGRQRRAPQWMQRLGFEWLHRMAHDPARLGPRYLRDGMMFAKLMWRELGREKAAPEPARTRVAYVVNQYPLLSHSFIRREVRALEEHGVEVQRISIRAPSAPLLNPADREELGRTQRVLDAGARGLGAAALRTVAGRPFAALRALGIALRAGWRSPRGVARHLVYWAEACLVREWTEAFGAQHVHAHFGTNSAMVALLCRVLGGPAYSFTAHGPEEFDDPRALSLPEKIRAAEFVVGVSEFGRGELQRWCGDEPREKAKIEVVHCGVDDALLGEEPVELPPAPRAVCVGRLSEAKGHRLLIEAAALLAERGLAPDIAIVGDGPLRGDLEARIAHHGLEAHVHLLGALPEDEVQREIRAARVVVMPSLAEGLPVVIMEAFALGRPVVSSSVAGIPELVEDGVSGWVVPAGDVERLADALERALATGDEQLHALAREGAARVAKHHDALQEAARLAALFRDAVAQSVPRA